MRLASVLLLTLFVSLSVAAQDATTTTSPPASPVKPDYSPQRLTQIFSNIVEPPPKPEPAVKWSIGGVEFKALNMRWRVGLLPLFLFVPGNWRGRSNNFIDPFEMTGTAFPQTPRTWREGRELSKEMKRIERTERERAKISAKVQANPQ